MKVARNEVPMLAGLLLAPRSQGYRVFIGGQEFLVSINAEQASEQISKEENGGPRDITLTLPDGRRTTFRFSLVRATGAEAGGLDPRFVYVAKWTATAGVYATLTPNTDNRFVALFGLQYWAAAGLGTPVENYDFSSFTLTTNEGTQYLLQRQDLGEHFFLNNDGTSGFVHSYGQGKLTRILEVSGDSIYLASNQIAAYNASGELMNTITFARDSQGRISAITDPNGAQISYGYDTNGDLVSVTDRTGHTVQYVYGNAAFPHYLTQIIDPSGHTPLRTQYDSDGRLIGTIDADGNETHLDPNLANHSETVTDRLGNQTLYVYDNKGNVISQTDALGHTTIFTYDANNNVTSIANPLGDTVIYSYDANGNILTEADPLGHTTTLTYDSFSRPLSSTDPLGNTMHFFYDAHENLLLVVHPLGKQTSYTYDANSNMTSLTDALGNATYFTYDNRGRSLSETDPLGHVTSYTYDANGRSLTQTTTRTTPSGVETLTTTTTYDAAGRTIAFSDLLGNVTHMEYNANGQQSETIDALGHVTQFGYDDRGKRTAVINPDGTEIQIAYDANGRRTSTTDPLGRVTQYVYDADGRLVKTIYPDGSSSTITFDTVGRDIASTDLNGNTTHYGYDASGRIVSVTDALGNVTSYTYDANDNETSMTDALGATTTFVYDALNNKVETIYPDGTTSSTVYDAFGYTITQTDQAGVSNHFRYDALGRMISVTDAAGGVTTYGYDEVNNEISQTDANGHTTTFEYDERGRRIATVLPMGQRSTMSYNAVGNVATTTDYNGYTTAYSYDSMNRVTQITPDSRLLTSGSSPISYTYTAVGQRASMTDASGTTTYLYNNLGRLTEKDTPEGNLSYTYDTNGNVLSIHSNNANGVSMNYTYDALNRVATVTDASGTADYGYDTLGNLVSMTYPNGVAMSYTYDSLNRLTNEIVTSGTNTIASYAYTLGLTGNRLAVTELGGRTVNYSYDNLYRLNSEQISSDPNGINGTISYTYDCVGNRLTRASTAPGVSSDNYAYDANNRLLTDTSSSGVTSYSYDANGNTISSGNTTYGYDFQNRLTSAITPSSTVSMTYDGDGNRVRETVGGVTTQFLVDDHNPTGFGQVVQEIQSGNVTRAYTYGDALISQRLGNQISFYIYDAHSGVRALVNSAGVITDTYAYDAFGNVLHQTGITPNHYLYRGEQFDVNLGFYNLTARYMNPQTGRFLNMDTFPGLQADPLTLHKYLYGNANPVNRVDPGGHWASIDTYGLLGAYFGPIGDIAIHQDAVSDVLGSKPSTHPYIGILREQQKFVDTFQSPEDSYRHAMRAGDHILGNLFVPEETVEHANIHANSFVRTLLTFAQNESHLGLPDQAMSDFGQAIHTLQDATSPAHNGFQIWGGWPNADPRVWAHAIQEAINPGWGSNLYDITGKAYGYFEGNPDNWPTDFFYGVQSDPIERQLSALIARTAQRVVLEIATDLALDLLIDVLSSGI